MEQAIKRAFIGELLKRIRGSRDLQGGAKVTQTDIANSLGIKSKSMVSMMEAGKASPPLERIREFSHAYNTDDDLTYILFRDLAPVCWDIAKAIVDDLTYRELIEWKKPKGYADDMPYARDLDEIADDIHRQYAEKVGLEIPLKSKKMDSREVTDLEKDFDRTFK